MSIYNDYAFPSEKTKYRREVEEFDLEHLRELINIQEDHPERQDWTYEIHCRVYNLRKSLHEQASRELAERQTILLRSMQQIKYQLRSDGYAYLLSKPSDVQPSSIETGIMLCVDVLIEAGVSPPRKTTVVWDDTAQAYFLEFGVSTAKLHRVIVEPSG